MNQQKDENKAGADNSKQSPAEKAAAVAAKVHKLKNPLVVDQAEARDPESGTMLYFFRVVEATNANGSAYPILLNERGKAEAISSEKEALFNRTVLTTAGAILASPSIIIQPDTNILTLNPGDTVDETIIVTIPKNAGPAKVDVYFLADTTGSMGSILSAVQAGSNSVLAALGGLGADMVFGVGNYKDFASGDPYAFQHQISPTNVAATVTAAINAWSASGGQDTPEGALFALDSLAILPGGMIGWRAGSKRIIVWFGDAPSHDPICVAVSGAAAVITEASATANLVGQAITVLAISTATPGLDADPKAGATGYVAQCGAPGGLPGQGMRIATATGGAFVTAIDAGNIVNTIINLVTGAVSAVQNLKLVPSASVAPFVTTINPPGGYGPLAGDRQHVLKFDVKLTGIPCKPEAQVISGTIDVVADGTVVASKKMQITVPACRQKLWVYSVKFICGVQPECGCECAPVRPGHYATEINLHNYSAKEVTVAKRFIPITLAGAPLGREPHVARVRGEDKIVLPAHTATMDDCCRISELLLGATGAALIPLTLGFLEITANADIAVTAVYTTSGPEGHGVSVAVERIQGQQQ